METDVELLQLRKLAPAGSTIYTIVRDVSRSGMTRWISPIAIIDGEPHHLAAYASRVLGRKWRNDQSVKCSGCGMDMGFELVYSIAQAIWGDGYALNQRAL